MPAARAMKLKPYHTKDYGQGEKVQVRGTLIQETFAWFCDQKNNRLQVV